jgi:glycosyltransferase involved in cell wall biosynthesis
MKAVSRPLVSVILPVFNGECYVSQAIESVLSQHYVQSELIVVDDGSLDNSASIARSYKEVHVLHQHNQGVAVARNSGITAARGTFIAFIDQDDLWSPNKLNVQVHYLMKNPEVQYVNAWTKVFVEQGHALMSRYTSDFMEHAHKARTLGTFVARKSLFERVGIFQPKFRIACDVEWFVRLKGYSVPSYIIPEVLLYKRIHNSNLSSDIRTNRKEVFTILRDAIAQQRTNKDLQLSKTAEMCEI